MALSEASAVVNLFGKAFTAIADLREGWYQGTVELDGLQSKLLFLQAQHGQWSEQLHGYGVSEDKHLQPLVEEAEKALEKFQKKVEKLQKSFFGRFRKKLFYRELVYLQEKMSQIVIAGPKLLEFNVANNEVLQKYIQQAPPPLHFGPDRKYVPIADSVLAVQKALENAEGSQVITLYGGPGTGKTSLVKHVAILYEEKHKTVGMAATFPHGVHYLSCRQDAGALQLLHELLDNLGVGTGSGTGSATQNDSATTVAGVQDEYYSALRANQIKLRSRLAGKKMLIILDNVWEPQVLNELLVTSAKGVKYFLTSEQRNIYIDSTEESAIPISRPSLQECSQILAHYTRGLPEDGELPNDIIKGVAADIIHSLEYHPLALANIGISINRDRATDVEEWNLVQKHIYDCLSDEFNDPYRRRTLGNFSVSASMMRMVEYLPPEELRLLFLMAAFNGGDLPEPLVKYFYSFIQRNGFWVKMQIECLLDKSLIHKTGRGNCSTLAIHRLRRHYILERKLPEVRCTVSQILAATGYQDEAKLMKREDGDDSILVIVLGAMYFDESLLDFLADIVTTRGLDIGIDPLDLVENAMNQKGCFESLLWLLTVDHDAERWKRQANKSAKKIITTFFRQGKLDDNSMASLLRLPQTTSAAWVALQFLYQCHARDFYKRDIMFSEAYGDTTQTLLDLFRNNAISMEARTTAITALLHVLDYETDDTILNFAAEYVKLFARESNGNLRDAGTHALHNSIMAIMADFPGISETHIFDQVSGHPLLHRFNSTRGILTVAEFPGILETLFEVLLVPGNGVEVKESAGIVIRNFCQYRHLAMKIAVLPDALKTLFHFFLSEDLSPSRLQSNVGEALCIISTVPKNRGKVGAIEGIWDGLKGILTKLEEAWRATNGDYWKMEEVRNHASKAATILGYLGLKRDLRDAIASFPGIREGLLFLQLIEISGHSDHHFDKDREIEIYYYSSTRALIILYSEELGDPRATDLPPVGDVLQVFSSLEGNTSLPRNVKNVNYFGLYWTRVLAYRELGSFAEALKILEVDLISKVNRSQWGYSIQYSSLASSNRCCTGLVMDVLMQGKSNPYPSLDCLLFLQAMLGDYAGALRVANRRLERDGHGEWRSLRALTQKGVVIRLCGDLQRALRVLHAVIVIEKWNCRSIDSTGALWQRGYVRYLMGDNSGAAADAELAQRLRHNKRMTELTTALEEQLWSLSEIPISYLGFSR